MLVDVLVDMLVDDAAPVGISHTNTFEGHNMALTDTAIKKTQPTSKLQKLSDGGGLQLHVTATGGKPWRWAYRFDGKQKTMALGIYPAVSLAKARERRDKARNLLAAGTDHMVQRRRISLPACLHPNISLKPWPTGGGRRGRLHAAAITCSTLSAGWSKTYSRLSHPPHL